MSVYNVTALTGGVAGCLDALGLDHSNGPSGQTLDLVHKDIAIYNDGTNVYLYNFDVYATDEEDVPALLYVRPNDFSTAGVWKLSTYGAGTKMDADLLDGQEGSYYYNLFATHSGSGDHDSRYYTKTQIDGQISPIQISLGLVSADLVSLSEDVYTKTEVDDLFTTTSGYLQNELDTHNHDDRYYTETELDAGQLDDRYYTETELDAGQLDDRYYTESELDAGQLDNRYYTENELAAGQLDSRYYTETEVDNLLSFANATTVSGERVVTSIIFKSPNASLWEMSVTNSGTVSIIPYTI